MVRTLALAPLALAAVLVASACGGQRGENGPAASTAAQTGSLVVVDRTWHCRGPVDLQLLRVLIHGSSRDAVHIDSGCTGTIERLEIPGDGRGLGPGGDGVKLHTGAHDLRVLGGYINCGQRSRGKHQDAIQAMGGEDVLFRGLSSRYCRNSFMFVNRGARGRGIPRGIRCERCNAVTRNYSVFVGHSVASGATASTFVSRVRPRATDQAAAPVLGGNTWKPRPR